MILGAELVVSNNIKQDILKDVVVHAHSESGNIQEDIDMMFHKYTETMSDAQIKNQMSQVINYEYNYLGFSKEDMASFMGNFSKILSEYTDDVKFLNSLKRSIECTVDGDIKGHIKDLESNNNKSFIIVNFLLSNHAFGGIIYKNDSQSYKFVIVNKGYRPRESQYEAYIVSKDNMNYIIDNCLGFSELEPNISVRDAYKIVEEKGSLVTDEIVNVSVSNVTYSELRSGNQKNGNCFYKNIEAAFLLAWHTTFNKDEKAVAPKGPISKKDIHIKFMENIKKNDKNKVRRELLRYADREINTYKRNKEFREYCKNNLKASADEKRRTCIRIFLEDTDVDNLREVEVETKIDDVLKIVDLETLENNREIFLVSDQVELINVVCKIIDKLKYIDFLDEEEIFELKDKFELNKESLYKNFPNVAEQLKKFIAVAMQSKIDKGKVSSKIFDAVMELNKGDIMFYLISENFDEYSKSKEEKLKEICSIIPNHKAAQLEYMCILISGNKLKEALDECEIIISKNEDLVKVTDFLVEILRNMSERGELEYVLEKYNNYTEIDKQKALAHYGLGVSHWLLGDKEKARENFEKAGELNFIYNECYLRFLQAQGENDEVITKSEELLKRSECDSISTLKATSILKNAISEDKKDESVENLNYAKRVFTDKINSKYNNELEHFWRGICNMKLHLSYDAVNDFNKVSNLDDSMVEYAIALTYDLGYKGMGLKRCGDYLKNDPDNRVINLLEDDIFFDLEEDICEGIIDKDELRQIFEDAIDVDNVDHFSEVKDRRHAKKDLCTEVLKDTVVKRLCERENISLKDSYCGFYEYKADIFEVVKSFWRKIVGSVRRR